MMVHAQPGRDADQQVAIGRCVPAQRIVDLGERGGRIALRRHEAPRRGECRADRPCQPAATRPARPRSEEHTSELQSLMRSSYAVFCLKKKKNIFCTKQREEKKKQKYTTT